ncbi:MAG: RagB/SusD family nutrient uptake outer membrane protein [bacterium]|nr:RagB/SusD family nutrient uptake outer membrane protein [bacterium]
MKFIRNTIVVWLVGFVMSCSSEFYDIDPAGVSLNVNYYSDESEVFSAVVAIYDPLGWHHNINSNWFSPTMFGEIRSDNAQAGGEAPNTDQPDFQALDDFNNTPTNIVSQMIYLRNYTGINRANQLFDNLNIPDAESNQNIRSLLAEARFLRALYHFELAKYWGPIPIMTSTETGVPERSSISEVYEFITSELALAATDLPDVYNSQFTGRATSGAANALLGKAYLYWGSILNDNSKFTDASNAFAQVFALGNQGVYTLVDDYKALWGFGTGNNTTESVFEIQHTNLVGSDWAENSNDLYYSRKEGNAFVKLVGIRGLCSGHPTLRDGWGWMYPSDELYNFYLTEDSVRRDASIKTAAQIQSECTGVGQSFDDGPGNQNYTDFQGYFQLKFAFFKAYDTPNGGDIQLSVDKNVPYIRYADVLLMYAESLVRQASPDNALAESLVNQVRARSNPSGFMDAATLIATDPEGHSFDNLLDVIYYERRVELALEGDRWGDLVRRGEASANIFPATFTNYIGEQVPNPRFNNFNSDDIWLPLPSRETELLGLDAYPDPALIQ